jgi:hypothetical protein
MKKGNLKKLILAFIFFIVAYGIELYLASNVNKFYPNLTISPDFILNHTPYLNVLWLADAIVLLSIISFLIFMFSEKKGKEVPFYAVMLGIYALLRGLLSYITPLANPAPNPGGLNFALMPSGAMFPSGHVGTIFLFFLFALNNKSKKWEVYFFILLILDIISLILSRGHYTIDIIGALFICYGIWKVGEEHFKKKIILD